MKHDFAALRKSRGTRESTGSTDVTGITEPTEPTEPLEATDASELLELSGRVEAALERAGISQEKFDELLNASKNGLPYPWRDLPVDGPRDPKKGGYQRPLRFNAYEKALIHYLAGVRQMTVNKLILNLVKKAALAEVRRRENAERKRA